MDENQKQVGVAQLFNNTQLKTYFVNYLHFIVAIEVLIFLVSCVGYLGASAEPFPWKFYFYVAFLVPIAITFLLGIFILAFNKYVFGKNPLQDTATTAIGEPASKNLTFRLQTLLSYSRQLPFLMILFLLVLGSLLFYYLDSILLFLADAGEKAIQYILIAAAVILISGVIISIVWLLANYKLRIKMMEQQYQYKNDVMERMEMLIMDDNTVISKDGKVISNNDFQAITANHTQTDDVQFLPAPTTAIVKSDSE
ncbi:hypothetical protein QUF75_16440 [Desulfococcaceae bacterium HSG7]|nr:hypothetical protein [Desulfococcaceae bacterium HSG9]MDM8556312.1 hypothetical protein [Desulfococcaceae bacterium HSG7]